MVNFTANSFLFTNFCRSLQDQTRNGKTNRKNKNETKKEEKFAKNKEERNSKCKRVLWKTWKRGIDSVQSPPPFPLHPSSHVFSLRHWKQRFGGDKLKYFISDVTNARCSYRVCSFFFRMDKRSKDRPRLCRHLGFGSVLRRAVLYQLTNVWYKFTAFDHFDGFQFLSWSTAWIITEHLEVFNRASKWGWSKTITALFTNMQSLKFKSRLHNWVFRCRQS